MSGPLARFAFDAGFTAVSFATWRAIASALALLVLLALGVLMRRAVLVPWSTMTRLEHIQLVAMGVFVTGTTLGLFLSMERTTIALTLIVFYTYPTIVAIAAVRIYGETLGSARVGAILMASLGMLILLLSPAFDDGGLRLDAFGVAFALVAAACQAGYALTASRGFASVPALQAATLVRTIAMGFYGLLLVPFVFLLGEGASLIDPVGTAWAWTLILVSGIVGAALPTAMLIAGYRRVGPTRGAVLMLFEPLVGVLLAAVLLSERPTPLQLVGGLLVLAGAALVQLSPTRRSATALPPEE